MEVVIVLVLVLDNFISRNVNFLYISFPLFRPERMSYSCDGQSPLCRCFVDISGVQSLYYNQYREYATSWELFRRVELYNSNVSTQKGLGTASNISYWQFGNNEEYTLYRQGAILFSTYAGYSTIVQKN